MCDTCSLHVRLCGLTTRSAVAATMIEGWSPFAQALSGTLFTWAVTALGAALVFVVPADIKPARLQRVLHAALGFSAGVMVAASFWSLLVPAFEFAEELGWGAGAWVPVAIGFAAGAVFVFCAGRMLPEPDAEAISKAVVSMAATHLPSDSDNGNHGNHSHSHSHGPGSTSSSEPSPLSPTERADHREASKRARFEARRTWRRILLVVVAITVHNIPEGAAVGVGFGGAAVGGGSAAFRAARALAIGIGLQVRARVRACVWGCVCVRPPTQHAVATATSARENMPALVMCCALMCCGSSVLAELPGGLGCLVASDARRVFSPPRVLVWCALWRGGCSFVCVFVVHAPMRPCLVGVLVAMFAGTASCQAWWSLWLVYWGRSLWP